MTTKAPLKDVPSVVFNHKTNQSYKKGSFLGKGGFARCYELTDTRTKAVVAGKIVSKTLLKKESEKDKMCQEIKIHSSLHHANVVGLLDRFEDDDNVYIILELCARRSLMELHKRRRGGITEPEARYFTYQIAEAVEYIHSRKLVHRDLKLGNVFINNEMVLKVGDFGLAAEIENEEQRLTMCGTPNYLAPEVLNKTGHSYEVDIWAIGCILYTLIVGKPPFETKELQTTYKLIRANSFRIPCWVSSEARALIVALLKANPKHRPPTKMVRQQSFFRGFMPERLPTSCLTMAPNFTIEQAPPGKRCGCCLPQPASTCSPARPATAAVSSLVAPFRRPLQASNAQPRPDNAKQTKALSDSPDALLAELVAQLAPLLAMSDSKKNIPTNDASEAPEARPVFWISNWREEDKYGMAYTLCDESAGVLYNDGTKMITDAREHQLAYVDKQNDEHFHTMEAYPAEWEKKVIILRGCRAYMNDELLRAGAAHAPKVGDELVRLPWLRNWFRRESAIVFHLSNGTVQINFIKDHIKLILCPLMGAVAVIDAYQQMRVFSLSLMQKHGCTREVYTRLRYAQDKCERLLKDLQPKKTSAV